MSEIPQRDLKEEKAAENYGQQEEQWEREGKEVLNKMIDDMALAFYKRSNIDMRDESRRPNISINHGLETEGGALKLADGRTEIYVDYYPSHNCSPTVAHEFGHAVRHLFEQPNQKKEELTGEFFAQVGLRLIFEGYDAEHRQKYFPGETDRHGGFDGTKEIDKHAVLNRCAKARFMAAKGGKPHLSAERINLLTHVRGYEAASRIDLSRINDWGKFFSTDEKDARGRFFGKKGQDMDYSGL